MNTVSSSLVFRDSCSDSSVHVQEKGSCVHNSARDIPILPTTSLLPSPPPQLSSLAIVSSVLFVLQAMIAVVEDWERGQPTTISPIRPKKWRFAY